MGLRADSGNNGPAKRGFSFSVQGNNLKSNNGIKITKREPLSIFLSEPLSTRDPLPAPVVGKLAQNIDCLGSFSFKKQPIISLLGFTVTQNYEKLNRTSFKEGLR